VTALHQLDCEPAGFEWIDTTDWEKSIICFLRKGRTPGDIAVVVCNFTPTVRHSYRVGVPRGGLYTERLNSDSQAYGGSNVGNAGAVMAAAIPCHGRPFSLDLTLPPLATLVLAAASEGVDGWRRCGPRTCQPADYTGLNRSSRAEGSLRWCPKPPRL
jgi:1,4-alpha-glucan branching enzyme